MPVGCCGHGVDWGAVLPSVILGISGHPGCAVCRGFMESCLTLSAQSGCLWAAANNLANFLNNAPKGRHHVTPAKTKSWAPLPAPGGGRGGGLPRGTGSLWASQAQGLACRLEGGQHIPGLGLCWAGLGNSCAHPGQRLIEAPGLGGQAAVCLCSLGWGKGVESAGPCPQPGPACLVGHFLVCHSMGPSVLSSVL